MKKFKQFLEELELEEGTGLSAADLKGQKDSDDEATTLKPRSKGEEDFKNMHNVTKTDYIAAPGQDHIFNGTIREETEEDEELSEEEKLAFDLEEKSCKGKKEDVNIEIEDEDEDDDEDDDEEEKEDDDEEEESESYKKKGKK